MKKFSLSGCLTKLLLTVIVVIGFLYGFSILFPRAYNVLEAKALGIENKGDTVITIIQRADSILKADTTFKKQEEVKGFDLAIELEHENGCYMVPVKLNGVPMKMMLDTGASNIVISIIEFEFLRKQKLIKDCSVKETQCTIANGDTTQGYTFNLSNVDIGGEIIKDVECVVMPQSDAPLLLGMNVLRKFGNVRIDYNRNLLILKE
jgi:clan AA aspartic protease (TIGR02281 family)